MVPEKGRVRRSQSLRHLLRAREVMLVRLRERRTLRHGDRPPAATSPPMPAASPRSPSTRAPLARRASLGPKPRRRHARRHATGLTQTRLRVDQPKRDLAICGPLREILDRRPVSTLSTFTVRAISVRSPKERLAGERAGSKQPLRVPRIAVTSNSACCRGAFDAAIHGRQRRASSRPFPSPSALQGRDSAPVIRPNLGR